MVYRRDEILPETKCVAMEKLPCATRPKGSVQLLEHAALVQKHEETKRALARRREIREGLQDPLFVLPLFASIGQVILSLI